MSRAFASALQQLADLSLKQGFVGVRSIELPLLPKFKSQGDGVDFDPLPPRSLVAPPVKLTGGAYDRVER